MRVYRASYKDRDGKRQESEKWYLDFRTRDGKRCKLPGFTDKARTEELGRKIDQMVGYQQSGEPVPGHLSQWIRDLPDVVLSVLMRQGVVEGQRLIHNKPLLVLLEGEYAVKGKPHVVQYDERGLPIAPPVEATLVAPGFVHSLEARGNRDDYAKLAATRVRTLIRGCGFTFWRDVTAAKVEHWLGEQRRTGKGKGGYTGMSAQTSNWYLQKMREFTAHVAALIGTADPLVRMKAVNVKGKERHKRKAMDVDEITRILAATWTGPDYVGIGGRDRWLVYRFALETGLRPKQIGGLTRASFLLTGPKPSVTAAADYSKTGKSNTIPLRPEFAELLREHMVNKTPNAPAFNLYSDQMRIRVFKRDLAAARQAWIDEAKGNPEEQATREGSDFLKYRDAAGRVRDFYACRKSFLSALAHGGVHPSVAQKLAGHSTSRLTLDVYTDVLGDSEAEALTVLPTFARPTTPATVAGA